MSARDYSPLARAMFKPACALTSRYVSITPEDILQDLEVTILRHAGQYDPSRGASLETFLLSRYKHEARQAYGSGRLIFCEELWDTTELDDDEDERCDGHVTTEHIEKINALPVELRDKAHALVATNFDRAAAAEMLGIDERQIRRACAEIIALAQAGDLPSQPALSLDLPAAAPSTNNKTRPQRRQAPAAPAAEQPALF